MKSLFIAAVALGICSAAPVAPALAEDQNQATPQFMVDIPGDYSFNSLPDGEPFAEDPKPEVGEPGPAPAGIASANNAEGAPKIGKSESIPIPGPRPLAGLSFCLAILGALALWRRTRREKRRRRRRTVVRIRAIMAER